MSWKRPRALTALAALVTLTGLAACGGNGDKKGDGGKVTITVTNLPSAKPDPAPRKQFQADVAAFEKLHPNIKIDAHEYVWAADTFPARLSSGQLETVYIVPFTEPQKLIGKDQAADITDAVKGVSQLANLNPKVLAVAQKDGKTYGVPQNAYAFGLAYNRKLFTQAGLDPDKPPTTWDDVRADANKIAALGKGYTGFVTMSQQGFGGWYLTIMNMTYGNDIEAKDGDHYKPNVTNDKSVAALQVLKDMRWTDKSMGSAPLMDPNDVIRQFGSGKVGMMLSTAAFQSGAIQAQGGAIKNDMAMGPMPEANGAHVTTTGGAMAMFNPKASDVQRKAGAEWIAYEYLRQYTDPAVAKTNLTAAAKVKNAVVGLPDLSMFNAEAQKTYEAAQKPFVNQPLRNYQTFKDSLNTLTLEPEPPIAAQQVYQQLEQPLQKILTDKNADPKSELSKASKQIEPLLANGS